MEKSLRRMVDSYSGYLLFKCFLSLVFDIYWLYCEAFVKRWTFLSSYFCFLFNVGPSWSFMNRSGRTNHSVELRQLHSWTYEEKCHIMESFGATPLALHIFTVLQASLTFRFFYALICGGLRVFKWFFWSLGIHSTIASVIGAVSCRTDCEWVFLQMKLGCDSDLPVWQVAVVVLSVGGEDLIRRSAVVSRTAELPVCAAPQSCGTKCWMLRRFVPRGFRKWACRAFVHIFLPSNVSQLDSLQYLLAVMIRHCQRLVDF